MVLAVSIWLRFTGFLGLWVLGQVELLYDLAPRRWLLVRDNQRTVGSLVDVIVPGLGLGNYGDTKKKGNQSCTSVEAFHK
jgi:hypothetical protein